MTLSSWEQMVVDSLNKHGIADKIFFTIPCLYDLHVITCFILDGRIFMLKVSAEFDSGHTDCVIADWVRDLNEFWDNRVPGLCYDKELDGLGMIR